MPQLPLAPVSVGCLSNLKKAGARRPSEMRAIVIFGNSPSTMLLLSVLRTTRTGPVASGAADLNYRRSSAARRSDVAVSRTIGACDGRGTGLRGGRSRTRGGSEFL